MDSAHAVTVAFAGGHHLPLPIIGALAVGIPALIVAYFFVTWDKPRDPKG